MCFNSFSAKGNIEVFANNADSGESAQRAVSPEISIVCILVIKIFKTPITREMKTPNFKHGRVYFKQFGTGRVKGRLNEN